MKAGDLETGRQFFLLTIDSNRSIVCEVAASAVTHPARGLLFLFHLSWRSSKGVASFSLAVTLAVTIAVLTNANK